VFWIINAVVFSFETIYLHFLVFQVDITHGCHREFQTVMAPRAIFSNSCWKLH